MPDFRSYCGQVPSHVGEHVTLSPEESNHLVAANRARAGDPVSVFDGSGSECKARLLDANKRKATLEIVEITQVPPPPLRIALAQALPKGKLMENIIRKASEIGAQQIFPIASQRCEAKVDNKKQDAKNAKWTAAAIEGSKQSGNPHLVEIEPITDFAKFIEISQDFQLKLIASLEPQAASLKKHLASFIDENSKKLPHSAICLIGPEGDFTPEEYLEAAKSGFRPLCLGPHVMRSETAAVHALSIIQYELTSS